MVLERAILAGGCFWGMEELFRAVSGVVETRAGYTGGEGEPVYDQVKTGRTGHAEALELVFDPAKVSYRHLLEFFFQIHDPTTLNRQGNDRGSQYRSAIFYGDEQQKQTAEAVIAAVDASGQWPGKVVTEIAMAQPFYVAEPEHQGYLARYPNGYTCHFVRPGWKFSG